MSEFDPLKAAREELTGYIEVARSFQNLENAAEEAMGKAEKQLNDVRKVQGFVRIAIEQCRQRVAVLEKAQAK